MTVDSGSSSCAYTKELHDGLGSFEEWECPHPSEDGENHCIFHLPQEKVSPDCDPVAAFISIVQNESPDYPSEFVGASFGDFEIDRSTLGSSEPIDLRHACAKSVDWDVEEICAEMNMRHLTVHGEADFTDIDFQRKVDLLSATFHNTVGFDEASFEGELLAPGLTCEDECNFDGAHFESKIDLSESTFEATVSMDDIICRGQADLYAIIFDEHVNFRSATFEVRVSCKRTSFPARTTFNKAVFHGEADFRDSTHEWTTFIESTFYSNLRFEDSKINAEIDFRDAELKGEASFEDAYFREGNFNDVSFHAEVDFTSAMFEWGRFEDTTFHEPATFTNMVSLYLQMTDAIFREDVSFRTELSERVLPFSVFYGEADFEGTIVDGVADLRILDTEGNLVSEQIPTFFGDVSFDNSRFNEAKFDGMTFDSESTLDESEYPVSFKSADLSNSSLRHADYTGVNLQDADMTNATCTNVDFVTANCEGANLSRANLIDADFSDTRLHGTIFTDARISEGSTFIDPGSWWTWLPGCTRGMKTVLYDPRTEPVLDDSDSESSVDGYSQAASVYSQLETLSRTNAATTVASTCFRWRKDMLCSRYFRQDNGTDDFRPIRGNFARLANIISRYGDSQWRVLNWSGVVILSTTILFSTVTSGVQRAVSEPPMTDLSTLLYFSIVTFTTMGGGSFQPADQTARWVAGIESLLGALLIALLITVLGRRATR